MRRFSYKSIYYAIAFLTMVVFSGVIGYYIIEDFTLIEAFYMTIITISTVGFEEVHSLSQMGMLFTSVLIIVSFGVFAFVITSLTASLFQGSLRYYLKFYKVNKRIKHLNNHVIICGYGRNGRSAAIELGNAGVPFVIIEKEDEVIEEIREESDMLFVQGDGTKDEVLEAAGIFRAKAIITVMPIDADNLFLVLTARNMCKKVLIISRASDSHSVKKLKLAGANNVIMPDRIGGIRMAKLVMQPDIVEFLEYLMLQSSDDVKIRELSCESLASCFDGKAIDELYEKNDTGTMIIGVKTKDTYIINPSKNLTLSREDKLFVLGSFNQISEFSKLIFDSEI